MEKKIIYSEIAPHPVGPYSQAVACGGFLFTAGQIGIDPKTGKLAGDGVREQALQVMKYLSAVLSEAGASFDDVVKSTIFLKDMGDFSAVNEIYGQYFRQSHPARSTIQVAALPLGALAEIEVIAMVPSGSPSF
ncbi:MAG: RidA family protein [Nitrospinae bacterium]|nr:RidA family protein [Nitrospinota bacterium]